MRSACWCDLPNYKMTTDLPPALQNSTPELPFVADLMVAEHHYRIVLPHAATDYIQKKLATDRTPYEQDMLEDIRDRVSPSSLVLDIGANIGNHTLYLAAVAGCFVESFEPNPELCAALRESIALNGFGDRVRLHEAGLARSSGAARFGVSLPHNLGGQHLTLGEGALRVSTLDSFAFAHPVAVIKLDVEGMEIDVLEGGRCVLERDRPLVYVECGTEVHYRKTAHWLSAQNYTYWETFNATPTHLFIPTERLSIDERLQHLQSKSAQHDYKSRQILREIRLRATKAEDKEREARALLAEAEIREREAGSRLSILSAQLQAAEERLADNQRQFGEQVSLLKAGSEAAQVISGMLQSQLDEARREVAAGKRLSEEADIIRRELDQSKMAIQKLSRTVEVREARLAATQRRETALAERLERTRQTAAFQIGQALVTAGQSVGGMAWLPLNLFRIYRNVLARQRRATESAMSSIDSVAAQSPAEEEKRSTDALSMSPKMKLDTCAPVKRILLPAALPQPAMLAGVPAKLKQLKVAAIMDEFTHHSFQPECELMPLRSASWRAQVEALQPDLVFIESAWRGAEGDWPLKISNPSEELAGVIGWAQARHIPTVFWNKEDPVHFGGFLHVARAVDYVFTTDIDCIARYKREVGHDRVYLLPFAAQPATHNPVETFPREDGYCFAGSYYLKYPERQRDFRALLEVIRSIGRIDIFDRNFDKPHPHYEFPPEYRPFIVGNLPFDKIDHAYKGYRYGINMNTIKQSQTMFARRVFELLASNTVVVSNFSRGVRLFFGDLVICSDAADELRRRLNDLRDEITWRKFRLLGLRKVFSEHTYAHRLAYIVNKLGGGVVEPAGAGSVCAVAFPRNTAEAEALLNGWQRQTLRGASLCLVGSGAPPSLAKDGVSVLPDTSSLAAATPYASARWIAPLSAADHHGANYLADLLLATQFGQPGGVGKAAHYRCVPGAERPELVDGALAYRPVERLPARASLIGRAAFESLQLGDADGLERANWRGDGLIAIDEFNYLRDAGPSPTPAALATVSDLANLRTGLDLTRDLVPRAERIAAATYEDARSDHVKAPGLSAQQLAEILPRSARGQLVDGQLHVRGSGDPDKHRYVYFDRVFSRADLNLETNSRYELIATRGETLDVRTVFEFLDEQQVKIGHAMVKIGSAQSMAIPARCRYMRFGLRLQGSGEVRIDRLVLADLRERPSTLVPTGDCLLVAKQYPAYDDLYRYGFVHSRVRAYRAAGTTVDVLRLNMDEPCAFREFEGTDIIQGDRDLLDLALREGRYRYVLVHLLDAAMWEALERHLDRIRLTVWVHGAEIQVWQRREFEFERMDAAEVERQKKLSDNRLAFWREVLLRPHPNLRLVFVSQHFAQETTDDLRIDLASVAHEIIHNYIDPNIFPFAHKSPEDRLRLLSIRPFASRKYANDLTVKALISLKNEPWFKNLQITIVGDGELFEEVTQPLRNLANVTLLKRFLTQAEIAQMHREHGVFLTPTRMDAQGVSRDEAMSSGLVPITNRVAAVPEFVDESCGFLAPEDDADGLASAIRALYEDPQLFLRMSQAASMRVRDQSGFGQTIARELALISLA